MTTVTVCDNCEEVVGNEEYYDIHIGGYNHPDYRSRSLRVQFCKSCYDWLIGIDIRV